MIQDYIRAKSKDEVVELLEKGYSILGGGTYLSRNQDTAIGLIDIQDLGLNQIKPNKEALEIGAFCSFGEICNNPYIWETFKSAIQQELKINQRNKTTIAGHTLVANGFSNILGWLVCADASVHYYPENGIYPNKIIEKHLHNESEKDFRPFIDSIMIPLETSIVWEMISRTPDDFPLVGVFYNQNSDHTCITLTGFCEVIVKFEINNTPTILEFFQKQLINAHSQFTNKYVSFDYYFNASSHILRRLLERGTR